MLVDVSECIRLCPPFQTVMTPTSIMRHGWIDKLGSGLFLWEEIVTGVDCCDFVVGGPTSAFLRGADGCVLGMLPLV